MGVSTFLFSLSSNERRVLSLCDDGTIRSFLNELCDRPFIRSIKVDGEDKGEAGKDDGGDDDAEEAAPTEHATTTASKPPTVVDGKSVLLSLLSEKTPSIDPYSAPDVELRVGTKFWRIRRNHTGDAQYAFGKVVSSSSSGRAYFAPLDGNKVDGKVREKLRKGYRVYDPVKVKRGEAMKLARQLFGGGVVDDDANEKRSDKHNAGGMEQNTAAAATKKTQRQHRPSSRAERAAKRAKLSDATTIATTKPTKAKPPTAAPATTATLSATEGDGGAIVRFRADLDRTGALCSFIASRAIGTSNGNDDELLSSVFDSDRTETIGDNVSYGPIRVVPNELVREIACKLTKVSQEDIEQVFQTAEMPVVLGGMTAEQCVNDEYFRLNFASFCGMVDHVAELGDDLIIVLW